MRRKLITATAIFGILVLMPVCFLLASCARGTSGPETQWDKTLGGAGIDEGFSVQQTQDGGYVIAGLTESSGAGGDDVWLIKTDPSGNKKWDKTFGGPGGDTGLAVQQTQDGGYIIAGMTDSYGAGLTDIWLIKADSEGNKLWDRTFGGTDYEYVHSVQQTQDGGYVIAGSTTSTEAYGCDAWLIKTDSEGNKSWDETFGGSGYDEGYSVQQTQDGGYIIAGSTESFAAGGRDVWLIKTDSSGNMVWNKTFSGSGYDEGHLVQQTHDGGYIIAGMASRSCELEGVEGWLIKTDSEGNAVWNKTFAGLGAAFAQSAQQTRDEGYIVAGITASSGAGMHVWLLKTDSEGNKLWDRTYSRTDYDWGSDWGNSVQQTQDGGYIVVGWTVISSPRVIPINYDVWLIKTSG